MKTSLYRASNLKSTITFLAFISLAVVKIWRPVKNCRFLRFIHNNNNKKKKNYHFNHHQLLHTGFLGVY